MPFYGEGLDGLLRARSKQLSGIVNGIDYNVYNPKTDKDIAVNYSVEDVIRQRLQIRQHCKRNLDLRKIQMHSCLELFHV